MDVGRVGRATGHPLRCRETAVGQVVPSSYLTLLWKIAHLDGKNNHLLCSIFSIMFLLTYQTFGDFPVPHVELPS